MKEARGFREGYGGKMGSRGRGGELSLCRLQCLMRFVDAMPAGTAWGH